MVERSWKMPYDCKVLGSIPRRELLFSLTLCYMDIVENFISSSEHMVMTRLTWGSNRGPSACEPSILPLDLT